MIETQLSLFDAPTARKHQRTQKDDEVDALMVQYVGAKETKKWHDKKAKTQAKLAEILSKPLHPDLQAAANDARATILASAKPLSDKRALLGIEQGASKRDIKNAYRRKARKLHPDVGGDAASFKQIYETYRLLLKQAHD